MTKFVNSASFEVCRLAEYKKNTTFVTNNVSMDNTSQKIISKIESFGRGKIFFTDDFMGLGTDEAIRQTLKRLIESGKIIRVAQGIYCYPEIDEKLGLGLIYPAYEHIAESMAQRSRARIFPAGEYALNVLGLSTQVPLNYVFLTDGPTRHLKVSNGGGITFKRVSPKNLAFTNRLAMLLTSALKSLKKENLTEEQIRQIRNILQKEDREAVMADMTLMPAWIRNIVRNAYE